MFNFRTKAKTFFVDAAAGKLAVKGEKDEGNKGDDDKCWVYAEAKATVPLLCDGNHILADLQDLLPILKPILTFRQPSAVSERH
jgi:hypothetical protein